MIISIYLHNKSNKQPLETLGTHDKLDTLDKIATLDNFDTN